MLARSVIAQGGVVYGAVFDDEWLVRHARSENEQQAAHIRGSKYMQSRLDDCLREIAEILRSGRPVLFSGTSCQTAGARKVLGRDPKLLLVDVVCHSVPSPKVWKHYLQEVISGSGLHDKVPSGDLQKGMVGGSGLQETVSGGLLKSIAGDTGIQESAAEDSGLREKILDSGFDIKDIRYISFRDKSRGWKNFSLVIGAGKAIGDNEDITYNKTAADGSSDISRDKNADDENKTITILSELSRENAYMRGFIKGLYSRPSCAVCPAKAFASGADITIADFWGEDEFFPEGSDDRGTTLAFTLTEKGSRVLGDLDIGYRDITLEQAVKHNPRIMASAVPHPKRGEFFAGLGTVAVDEMVRKFTKRTLKERIIKRIRR